MAAKDLGIDPVEFRRRNLIRRRTRCPTRSPTLVPPEKNERARQRRLPRRRWSAASRSSTRTEKRACRASSIDGRYHGIARRLLHRGRRRRPARETRASSSSTDGAVRVYVGSASVGQGLETVMRADRRRRARHADGEHPRAPRLDHLSSRKASAPSIRARWSWAARPSCWPPAQAKSARTPGERREGRARVGRRFGRASQAHVHLRRAPRRTSPSIRETGQVRGARLRLGRGHRARHQSAHRARPGDRRRRCRGWAARSSSTCSTTRTGSSSPARSPTTCCRPRSDFPQHPRHRHWKTRPRRNNPLGAKGARRRRHRAGGRRQSANAVARALAPLGVEARELPLSPPKVWELIQSGK